MQNLCDLRFCDLGLSPVNIYWGFLELRLVLAKYRLSVLMAWGWNNWKLSCLQWWLWLKDWSNSSWSEHSQIWKSEIHIWLEFLDGKILSWKKKKNHKCLSLNSHKINPSGIAKKLYGGHFFEGTDYSACHLDVLNSLY